MIMAKDEGGFKRSSDIEEVERGRGKEKIGWVAMVD